jgi:hypothetical protein
MRIHIWQQQDDRMSSRKRYHACSKEGGKKVQRDISAKEKASSQQVDKKTENRMRAMQKKNWGRSKDEMRS